MAKKAASPKSSKAKETTSSAMSPGQPNNNENDGSGGNDKTKKKVGATTSERSPSKSSPNKKNVSNRKRKASSEGDVVASATTINSNNNNNDDVDVKTAASAAATTSGIATTSEEQQQEKTTATNVETKVVGGSTEESADTATDSTAMEDKKPAANTGSATAAATTAKAKQDDLDVPPAIDLTKPIKRARTAYFIFSDEHRAAIQAKHKGGGVAMVAKEIGQMWSKVSSEDKEVYKEKAAMERERVAQQIAQLEAAGIDLKNLPGAAQANTDDNNTSANANGLIFPLARIRKTIKLDPEVKNMSKEALMLVTKCTELMTGKLGIETVRVAQIQNRRTLLPDDVANVTQNREQFLFLKDDVKDLVREQVVQKLNKQSSGSGSGGSVGAPAPNSKEARAIANSKPLTAYFAVASKNS